MATSGSVTTNAYSNRSLTFSWSRVSYSIENNTTTISWTLKGSGSQSQWFMSGPFLVKINNVQQYYSSNRIQLSNGTTVASGTYTVQHDSVGWGAFTVYIEGAIYSYSVNVSASQQFVMETIPRATTPSVSGTLKMGNTITINLPRASSSFTHIVTYSFGSVWDTISSNAGASVQWTIPRSLAQQIPNGLTGTLYISAQTKNSSGTVIGTKQISVTLQVSDSDVPSISSVSHSENISGLAVQFGFYIQYKSRLNVSIGASGIYGSTIKSYSTTFDGSTYSGASFTTGYISKSGNLTMTVTVTDSRGRSTSKTVTVAVTAYPGLSISSFTAKRVDSNGVDDEEEGTYLKVAYSFSIPALSNRNTKSYKLEYKTQAGSTWTTLQTGSVYSANTTFMSTSSILDVDQSYTIRLTIFDYFADVSASFDVSVAFVLLDYHNSGRGMAVGKVAESADLFDVAMESRFRNNLTVDGGMAVGGMSRFKGGFYTANSGGTGGSGGHCRIARITITNEYANHPIKFTIGQRGRGVMTDLYLTFENSSGNDPGVAMFYYIGEASIGAYITKAATSTWDLYITKSESWDNIGIMEYSTNFNYMSSKIDVQWMYDQVSAVPGSYIGATNYMRQDILNQFARRVVNSGVSGIWDWRQWDNGMKECWGTWSGTINLGENNYSGFQYSNAQQINLPSGLFSSPPMFWADMGPTSFIGICRAFSRTTDWVRFICAGHMNTSQSGVLVFIHVVGW